VTALLAGLATLVVLLATGNGFAKAHSP